MPTYTNIQKEETLKSLVHKDFFSGFGYEPNIDNIDFVITDKKTTGDLYAVNTVSASTHYLWAEAKKGVFDVESMLTQLILTFKKTYDKGDYMPPPFIGCFDSARIAFLPFNDILPIFSENDFNWNITPSNHDTADFQKAKQKVIKLIGNITVFHFETDAQDIKDFIRTHFVAGCLYATKKPITKSNFMHIYNRWVKEVMPTINIGQEGWAKYKKKGLLDCDFYLADIMSEGGNTIDEKLNVILENDIYKLQEEIENEMWSRPINWTDDGVAYRRFWNKYERPPAEEYQQYIIGRRDLLVPQNVRQVKGSFFTPPEWVEKSQEYMAASFGENWQDEYYVWDCAAGTGNLLAGLVNKYNVWASTVDQPDVFSMHSAIQDGFNLLDSHVFQFDFLNDSFDKLPPELKKIIDDSEKRKKLIVYINPPYAEATEMGVNAKSGVSTQHKTHDDYKKLLGKASNELFSQFIIRIADLIPQCNLAMFSTLKYLNSSNFKGLRRIFSARFMNGFMVRADTFDNVHGKFPIGFLIWKLTEDYHISQYEVKPSLFPNEIKLDVLDAAGNKIAVKGFYNEFAFINDWITKDKPTGDGIGILYLLGNDFQQNKLTHLSLAHSTSHYSRFVITKDSLIKGAVYLAARHCFEHTWLNDRDQFFYPNDGYKSDIEFQNDCLIFTLFHGQNHISTNDGTNHWIPFTETEVDAREKFESAFMSNFLADKTFSAEAKAVLDAGRELWRYYHAKTKGNNTVSHNASFYDIRAHFQGRKENGTMNTKSTDETYNALLADLRGALKTLTVKIQPKVYEYGFLRE